VLHGGMDARDRAHAAGEFRRRTCAVLLATDVAAEGLNLQTNCRIVISLELPWTPSRLEQRIGRVDRIGQARTVHAFNLLARGTAETGVLSRLLRRLDSIRRRLGDVASPIGDVSDEAILDAIVDRQPVLTAPAAGRPPVTPRTALAAEETKRAGRRRARWRACAGRVAVQHADVIARLDASAPWVSIGRRAGKPGILAVFRVRVVHAVASAFDEIVIPLFVRESPREGEGLRAFVRRLTPALQAYANHRAAARADVLRFQSDCWSQPLMGRLHAIAADPALDEILTQQELFRRVHFSEPTIERRPAAPAHDASHLPPFEPPELLLVRITPR
jgi:helicase-like protein